MLATRSNNWALQNNRQRENWHAFCHQLAHFMTAFDYLAKQPPTSGRFILCRCVKVQFQGSLNSVWCLIGTVAHELPKITKSLSYSHKITKSRTRWLLGRYRTARSLSERFVYVKLVEAWILPLTPDSDWQLVLLGFTTHPPDHTNRIFWDLSSMSFNSFAERDYNWYIQFLLMNSTDWVSLNWTGTNSTIGIQWEGIK